MKERKSAYQFDYVLSQECAHFYLDQEFHQEMSV